MQRVKKKVIAYLVAIAMLLSLMPQVSMTANAAAENSPYRGTVSNIVELADDNSNLPSSQIAEWTSVDDEGDQVEADFSINSIDTSGLTADEDNSILVIVGYYKINDTDYYQYVWFEGESWGYPACEPAESFEDYNEGVYVGTYTGPTRTAQPRDQILNNATTINSLNDSITLTEDDVYSDDRGNLWYGKAYKINVDPNDILSVKLSSLDLDGEWAGVVLYSLEEGEYQEIEYSQKYDDYELVEQNTNDSPCDYYILLYSFYFDESSEGEARNVQVSVSDSYVYKKKTTITGASTFNKTYGNKAFSLGAKANSGAKLSYSSSNKNVATVSSSGVVTPKNPGTAKITIKAPSTDSYKAATKTVTVKVNKANQQITNAVSAKTIKYSALKKKTQTFAMGAKAKGKVTYKKVSGNKKITVSGSGKVSVKKGLKKGTYKLKVKVSAASTKYYNAKSITKTIKIKVK